MSNYKIISLGGSIVIPPSGFDISFLKKFRALIVKRVKKGEKFVFIVGGGATARNYIQAAKKIAKMSAQELDWIGINATWINADFVRRVFGKLAYSEIVIDPTKKIKTRKPIIVAGGWRPGCSTDYDAVLLAKNFGAKELVNMSNIDYVYTADPKKVKSAKPLAELTWAQMKKLVGRKWVPGKNVPMDPKAVAKASILGLTVYFVKGSNLAQFSKILDGKRTKGTIIK